MGQKQEPAMGVDISSVTETCNASGSRRIDRCLALQGPGGALDFPHENAKIKSPLDRRALLPDSHAPCRVELNEGGLRLCDFVNYPF